MVSCRRRSPGFRPMLEARTLRLLRPAEPPRASLRRIDWDGQPAVSKDFFDSPAWYRRTLGRFLIGREAEAYRRLQGVPGIPRLLARPRPDVLVLEYVPGTEVGGLPDGGLPPQALEQLRETLDGMHREGVLHLDLGHDSNGNLGRETNMIWSEWGRLYVVDFAGAMFRPLPRRIFEDLAAHDRLALTKLRRRFFEGGGPAGAEALPAWVGRLFRKLKKL